MDSVTESVLVAIRKIIHASDMYSRHIRKTTGRTSPQLLLLKAISTNPGATIGQLAQTISLSQATTTTVLDKLESEGLAQRTRSTTDRRKVSVELTNAGQLLLQSAPEPLQQQFIEQFEQMRLHERTALLASLQHIVELMVTPMQGIAEISDLPPIEKTLASMPIQKPQAAELI